MHDLGILYCEKGNHNEGMQLLKKAQIGRETALGVDAALTEESREALRRFNLLVLMSAQVPTGEGGDMVESVVLA
jgi:hypothetical protein